MQTSIRALCLHHSSRTIKPVLGSEHPQYVPNHANSVITNTKFESLASDLLVYFVFNLIP